MKTAGKEKNPKGRLIKGISGRGKPEKERIDTGKKSTDGGRVDSTGAMEQEIPVSESELAVVMEEVELLIAYLSRNGKEPASDLLESVLEARNRFVKDGDLNSEMESKFWVNYRLLAQAVQPATVSSIQETSPSGVWKKRHPNIIRRVKLIPIYYGAAVFILIILTVSLQTYSMIGAGVLHKTYELFNQRNQVRIELKQLKRLQGLDPSGSQIRQVAQLERDEQQLDQEFDANRLLLFKWNDVWQLGADEVVQFSSYDNYTFTHTAVVLKNSQTELQNLKESPNLGMEEKESIQAELKEVELALYKLNKRRKLDESRNIFFTERLSAVYVVNLLEQYILPLLFGCLGAFTLVLRTLHEAFQQGTFTLKNVLDYNIRIVLGGVTGISTGMFFSDSATLPSGQFGPMLMAFVVGYNVEILFMLMDDLATRLSTRQKSASSQKLEKEAPNKTPD